MNSVIHFCRDIKRGHCARLREARSDAFANIEPLTKWPELPDNPRIRHLPCAGVGFLEKDTPRKSSHGPAQSDRSRVLGRFYRQLSPFLPKLAPSSRHDELGARLARSILLPAAMWQDLLSLDTMANPDAPVFRSRTGKALDRFASSAHCPRGCQTRGG